MTAAVTRDPSGTGILTGPARVALDAHAADVMAGAARTFDLASRLLPGSVRRDVRRLYLVLRTLDDLVDHEDPGAVRAIAEVEAWVAGAPPRDTCSRILADLAERHPSFPRDAMKDFLAGMRADLTGPRHVSEDDLARYCYQVAGTVGRMMAAILGVQDGREQEADAAARALGMAMQRTNIVRDLVEDAGRGRVYVPHEAFQAAGLAADHGAALLVDLPSWPIRTRQAFIRSLAARADADYRTGLEGIHHLRTGRRAIVAATLMYREILRQVEREDFGGRRPRVVVPRRRKVLLALRALLLAR